MLTPLAKGTERERCEPAWTCILNFHTCQTAHWTSVWPYLDMHPEGSTNKWNLIPSECKQPGHASWTPLTYWSCVRWTEYLDMRPETSANHLPVMKQMILTCNHQRWVGPPETDAWSDCVHELPMGKTIVIKTKTIVKFCWVATCGPTTGDLDLGILARLWQCALMNKSLQSDSVVI